LLDFRFGIWVEKEGIWVKWWWIRSISRIWRNNGR